MISLVGAVLVHIIVVYLIQLAAPLIGTDGGVTLALAPAIVASLIGAGGSLGAVGLGAALGGKKRTVRQVPLETPEQAAARQKLLAFGSSGIIPGSGGARVGEKVPLQFGDFTPTGAEQTGLTALQDLLATKPGAGFQEGRAALSDFLGTGQENIDRQFGAFKTQAERELRDRENALKRGAAFGGRLLSTATARELGNLQARGGEAITSELARLVDKERGRRLSAIPLSFQAAEAEQAQNLQRIAASQEFGSLTRHLNTQRAKTRDAELLRRRKELFMPLDALTSVSGAPVQFGVPEVSTSPFQEFLSLAGKLGGQLGTEALIRKFPSGKKPPPKPPAPKPQFDDRIPHLDLT